MLNASPDDEDEDPWPPESASFAVTVVRTSASVVPLAASERAAAAWGCPLLVVDDDHALHHSVDAITALLHWQLHR